MRIKILLSPTDTELPINHQHLVNSFIHRALGKDNEYHDAKNNYSISPLQGGNWIKGTKNISFNKGGYVIISSLDDKFINNILMSLYSTNFYKEIKVIGIEFVDEKFYNGWNHFVTLSPFIIKKYLSKKEYSFHTIDEDGFDVTLKNYLINKLTKINPDLDLTDFDVKIPKHDNHKTSKVIVKNVVNIGNSCHININTNRKVAELLYNIGIGQSTGCGFGTIYKSENKTIYR
jgi:CRISPR-associated endoribonuclease Cas6|tara:strand:+ start:1939 stop:2634 length:696 start_codon:yes stop_codon:yes gene_type:complete